MDEWRSLPLPRRLRVLWLVLRGGRATDATEASFVAAFGRGLTSFGVTRGWIFLILGVADLVIAAWLVLAAPVDASPWRWIAVAFVAVGGLVQAVLPFSARRAARLNDRIARQPGE